jgi:hypothetical protein
MAQLTKRAEASPLAARQVATGGTVSTREATASRTVLASVRLRSSDVRRGRVPASDEARWSCWATSSLSHSTEAEAAERFAGRFVVPSYDVPNNRDVATSAALAFTGSRSLRCYRSSGECESEPGAQEDSRTSSNSRVRVSSSRASTVPDRAAPSSGKRARHGADRARCRWSSLVSAPDLTADTPARVRTQERRGVCGRVPQLM